MNLSTFRKKFTEELSSQYPASEVRTFFNWLFEAYLGLSHDRIPMEINRELGQGELEAFEDALHQLKQNKPIQYILSEVYFYGLQFQVNPSVLIPRPETEELVDWVLQDYRGTSQQIRITEIGTGSGCIAVSLAKNNTHLQISAIDVSSEALAVANQNASLHRVDVAFLQQDALALQQLPEPVDVIVSNPPYVKYEERLQMSKNVLNFEPHLALFVKDDSPFIFYEKIISLALQMQKVPVVYVEISALGGTQTKALFEDAGFTKVELRKDIFGRDRMIKATY